MNASPQPVVSTSSEAGILSAVPMSSLANIFPDPLAVSLMNLDDTQVGRISSLSTFSLKDSATFSISTGSVS